MEIDREVLLRILEAFVDASEISRRELMLHQMLFAAACKIKGLTDEEIEKAVDRGRVALTEQIQAASQADYQSLREILPRLVELLVSDQDAALRLLKEWTPKGLAN